MVPMWTIASALTLGNCVILKPSEKAPLAMQRIAELMTVSGIPHGVVQIVHGTVLAVCALCDHPGISAVTFVGSSKVAEIVSKRCHAVNKRVLALGGAKNHLLALPDCDLGMTSRDIVASFAGCAGQRCMAASVLLLVGDGTEETKQNFMDTLIKEVVTITGKLAAGQKGGEVGPLIDDIAQKRCTFTTIIYTSLINAHLILYFYCFLHFTECLTTSMKLKPRAVRFYWTAEAGPRNTLPGFGWVPPSFCTAVLRTVQ